MREKALKLIKFILLTGMFITSGISILAEGESGEEADPVPTEELPEGVEARVTFTNAPTHQPDLYISKTVVCDSSGVVIPDQEFTFQLKVDGTAYAGKYYYVLDKDGNDVNVKEIDGQMVRVDTPKTSSSGTFTIKADQTAKFEYVGTKEFTITEMGSYQNFTVEEPAGGSYAGTVGKDGTQVNFKNRYTPPVSPVSPETRNGTLEVAKKISFPQGYTYADNEMPAFEYTLLLEGAPAKAESYDLYYEDNGKTVSNAGKTNEEGKFSLIPGTKAIFRSLTYNADYKLTESDKDGWRVVGSAVREGSTAENKTETFNNVTSSFIVTKKLSSGKTDESFTFTLFNSGKQAVSGARYWLYATNGTRVKENDGKYRTYETAENGTFTLKQNQAAVFIGIPTDSVYSVVEKSQRGFVQVLPASSDGYVNKKVQAAGNEELPFVNEIKEELASLSVTKTMTYIGGDAPLDSRSFVFRLEKYNENTGEYTVEANAIYTVGGSTENRSTSADGTFELKANEVAVFDRLGLFKTYRVTEISKYTGYQINDSYSVVYNKDGDQNPYLEGQLTDERMLTFDFNNTYKARKLNLQIYKKTSSDDSTPLSGAEFGLFYDEACTLPYETKDGVQVTYVTDSKGSVLLQGMKEGTFYLQEVSAPVGYKVIPKPVKLVIKRDQMTDAGGNTYETFIAEAEFPDSEIGTLTVKELIDTDATHQAPLTFEIVIGDDNAKSVVLPATGGRGVYLFLLLGAALIAFGVNGLTERKISRCLKNQ